MESVLKCIIPGISQSLQGLTSHLSTELNVDENKVIKAFETFSPGSNELSDLREEVKTQNKQLEKTLSVSIGMYTDKSFIVWGEDTKSIRDTLKNSEFSGKWKPVLPRRNEVWLFPFTKDRWNKLLKFLRTKNFDVTEDNQYHVSQQDNKPVPSSKADDKKETPKKKGTGKVPVKRTSDGKYYSDKYHFVFTVKQKKLYCVGYREEKDSETDVLTLDDVEKLEELGIPYDEDQVETQEEDDEYDLDEDQSEGNEDANYEDDE